jgi:hypothetical protein
MAKIRKQFKNLQGIPKGCPVVNELDKPKYVTVVELCEQLNVSNVAVRQMLTRHNVQPLAYEVMSKGVGYRFFYDRKVTTLWAKGPKQHMVDVTKLAKMFGASEKTIEAALRELKIKPANANFGLYEKKSVRPILEKYFWETINSGKELKK